MERCKSLCSLKSFLSYAPQLSGVSILCFYILSFLKAHIEKGCNCWWLWHPLLTDMAGNIPCFHKVQRSNTSKKVILLRSSKFGFEARDSDPALVPVIQHWASRECTAVGAVWPGRWKPHSCCIRSGAVAPFSLDLVHPNTSLLDGVAWLLSGPGSLSQHCEAKYWN